MDSEHLDKTHAIRDQIQTLLDERLMEADLVSVWPHVRYEWLSLHGATKHVVERAELRGPAFALQTVYETANQIIKMQELAESYRAQKDDLEGLIGDLFGQLGDV